MRIPEHIGVIPDGNRRWAESKGLAKERGYQHGLQPGVELLQLCRKVGVSEVTYYGFTVDNTKRPPKQIIAFRQACVEAVERIKDEDVALLVVGDTQADIFPDQLLSYTDKRQVDEGQIKVNFLVNYDWQWDLQCLAEQDSCDVQLAQALHSRQISQIDLIIRWGSRRRLSGFLPVQSVYADFYVVDDYWPNFTAQQFHQALEWYSEQDITYGG
ncbi:MAG: undecaprenyl diphosphate synthase family protein [Bacillota bacterium]